MAVVRVVDVGFGDTKFLRNVLPNGACEWDNFQSIAAVSTRANADIGGVFDRLDLVSIDVDGIVFRVGRDAAYAQGAFDRQSRDNSFAHTPAYQALTLGALWHMQEPVIDRLVVGLPLNTYVANRDQLRKTLIGRHRLPSFDTGRLDENTDVEIEIKSVHVMPQPMGALLYHATSTKDVDLMSGVSLVLDLGYYTLDFMVTRGTRMFPERQGAIEGGMSAAYDAIDRAITAAIRAEGGMDVSLSDKLYLYAQALQHPDMTLRTSAGCVELKPLLRHLDHAIEQQLKPVLTRIGNVSDIQHLILAGGGATYLEPLIKNRFVGFESIFVADKPQYSNLYGYYTAGLRWQQEADAAHSLAGT